MFCSLEALTTALREWIKVWNDSALQIDPADMHELLSQLDGSRAAGVAMLAGLTRRELEPADGVPEGD